MEGTILSESGTLLPESEYEFDGVTRPLADGTMHTYSQGSDQMGEYRIPATMQRTVDDNLKKTRKLFLYPFSTHNIPYSHFC